MADPIKSAFDAPETDGDLFDNFIVPDEFAERARRRRVEPEVVERIIQVVPENALLYQPDGSIQAGHFTLTKTGLIIGDEVTKEEWGELGQVLKGLNQSLQWIIGDWVNYGEKQWRETYDQIAEQTGLDKTTIYDFAYVARSVHFSVRTETLSFGHHKLVAKFDRKIQRQWLDYAAEKKLSVNAMRQQIKAQFPAIVSNRPLMDGFTRQYTEYAKQQLSTAKKAQPHERRQMADMLRKLAETIEGME